MQLMAHNRAYRVVVASDEVIATAVTNFMNMDCFVVHYRDGGEFMVDHLECIDCMFKH